MTKEQSIVKERFQMCVAAYLLLVKDEKILLLRRYKTGYQDGNYTLIAGHLNGMERASDCIIREAKEEADIALDTNHLKAVHIMHRFSPDREYIDIYFTADRWSSEVKNMEREKCDDFRWFPRNELPDNILPGVKMALSNISKGVIYCEFGWEK